MEQSGESSSHSSVYNDALHLVHLAANETLGDLLVSSGDDGSVRTWKKALNGKWLEYSTLDLTPDS